MSLVPIVALGAVLAHTVSQQAEDRNLENAREAAQFFAQFGIASQLSQADIAKGLNREQISRLDQVVSASRT